MKFLLLLIVSFVLNTAVSGQDQKEIKGIIVDKAGNRIPYCNTYIKGTKIGVVTDGCGYFELPMPKRNFTIVFGCWFKPFEVRIEVTKIKSEKFLLFSLKNITETDTTCRQKLPDGLRKIIIQ